MPNVDGAAIGQRSRTVSSMVLGDQSRLRLDGEAHTLAFQQPYLVPEAPDRQEIPFARPGRRYRLGRRQLTTT